MATTNKSKDGSGGGGGTPTNSMKKSTKCTVFVRLFPTPQHQVLRHELENHFSSVGPIKKSSWISSGGSAAAASATTSQTESKGYGFVKYTAEEDAQEAARTLNDTQLAMNGEVFNLKVQLASASTAGGGAGAGSAASMNNNDDDAKTKTKPVRLQQGIDESHQYSTFDERYLKKHARIIVRNLSFYAKENHIRKCFQDKYGPVVDVHIPIVKKGLHVGFGFVTFANPKYAKLAVDDKEAITIKRRDVKVDWSVSKQQHDDQKQREKEQKSLKQESGDGKEQEKGGNGDGGDGDSDSDDSNADADADENEKAGSVVSSSDSDDSDSDEDGEEIKNNAEKESDDKNNDDDNDDDNEAMKAEDEAVTQKRTLFLRNLPFDATRYDVFQLFYKFGHIDSIFIVKDKETGMNKGTAFLCFTDHASADKVLDRAKASSSDAADGSKPSQDAAAPTSASNLTIRGRSIIVSLAVNKETASTFADKEQQKRTTDRRNLYLRVEDKVGDADGSNSWQFLPEKDKQKRQISNREKTTKLQSPLFFINPFRLSFKNLAKHVNELSLQKLCAKAIKKALKDGLVTADDQVKHWQASGEMSARDILDLVQEKESNGEEIIPSFEDGMMKDLIPSVFISRDMVTGLSKKTKSEQPSRGFGFIEFKYHIHALACLRELNNNVAYSYDYVSGGKVVKKNKKSKNKEGENIAGTQISRLIVDFTVENRVKVQKQLERRIVQQANSKKQRIENKLKAKEMAAAAAVNMDDDSDDEDNMNKKQKKKKSRGARQRERKRKQGAAPDDVVQTTTTKKQKPLSQPISDDDGDDEEVAMQDAATPTKKKSNKKKKKKTKAAESSPASQAQEATSPKKSGARWFD